MKIGHCPNCQTIYHEKVMRDGKIVVVTGSKVLGHEQPGVLETNYVEIYLLLTDFTITRLSLCAKCRLGLDQSILDKCWATVRRHMIMVSRSAGAWQQAEEWKNLGWISWHQTDQEARMAQAKADGPVANTSGKLNPAALGLFKGK